jgi:hypothetical protein
VLDTRAARHAVGLGTVLVVLRLALWRFGDVGLGTGLREMQMRMGRVRGARTTRCRGRQGMVLPVWDCLSCRNED